VSELIDVSGSVAESVPTRLPIDAVSEIILEVIEISVGGGGPLRLLPSMAVI
jgi:hypothetical protein